MTTDIEPVTITRFTQPLPEIGPQAGEWHVIPWSEVRDGDLALMDEDITPVQEVRVFLDDWGDGTVFVRVDVTTIQENGTLSSSEHKGDLLTCILLAPGDSPPPATEAWVAWAMDETVPEDDRCYCRLSRYGPHPRTSEHGHPAGSRA